LPDTDPATDYRQQTQRLADAVRAAGAVALKTFRAPLKSWTKGKDSPVCEADIAANELLHERLAGDGAAWLSEESLDDERRLAARRVWVIDRIDGTRACIAGLPDWTVAAARVEVGRAVAAALYAPVSDELFTATAGGGAFHNGAPMSVTPGDALDGARFGGPRGYLDKLEKARPAIVRTPRIHSLALRFARVADGTLDAGLASRNSNDWDLAAADLLVHEAGGLLTTFAGQALIYNKPLPVHEPLVAAGRDRHRPLLSLVSEQKIAVV
jgi:myo-inositol-1(or 4)-monophosphatase